MLGVGSELTLTLGTASRVRVAVLDEGQERIFCFDENGLPRPRESVRLPGGLAAPDSLINNMQTQRFVGGANGWLVPVAGLNGEMILPHFDGENTLTLYKLADGVISFVAGYRVRATDITRYNAAMGLVWQFDNTVPQFPGGLPANHRPYWLIRRNDRWLFPDDLTAITPQTTSLEQVQAAPFNIAMPDGVMDIVAIGATASSDVGGQPDNQNPAAIFVANYLSPAGRAFAEYAPDYSLTTRRYPRLIIGAAGADIRVLAEYQIYPEPVTPALLDSVFGNLAFAANYQRQIAIPRERDDAGLFANLNASPYYTVGYVRGKTRLYKGTFQYFDITETGDATAPQKIPARHQAIARIPTRSPDCILCAQQADAPAGVTVNARLKITTSGMHSFRDVIGEAAGTTSNISRRFLSEARVSFSGVVTVKDGGLETLGDYWGFRHDGRNYICVNARQLNAEKIAATFQEDIV